MSAASPPIVQFGWKAPDFRLADTRGKVWTRDTPARAEGAGASPSSATIAPTCRRSSTSWCGRAGRSTTSASAWRRSARTMPASHPEDSYEKMGEFAREHHFPFPYLHDVTQSVARAYGAACTPDFFGFNAELSCSIAGGSTTAGATRIRGRGASSTRRCGRWRRPGRGRASRCRRSAARSSGRRRDGRRRGAGR